MKDIATQLITVAIIVGLSDREAFVEKVSGIIERYENDPLKAEKWANALLDYLEETRTRLNMESSIQNALSRLNLPEQQKIEELTTAIKALTYELQQLKSSR